MSRYKGGSLFTDVDILFVQWISNPSPVKWHVTQQLRKSGHMHIFSRNVLPCPLYSTKSAPPPLNPQHWFMNKTYLSSLPLILGLRGLHITILPHQSTATLKGQWPSEHEAVNIISCPSRKKVKTRWRRKKASRLVDSEHIQNISSQKKPQALMAGGT